MNAKLFLKALSIKARQTFSARKRLLRVYVSLFLVMVLGVTTTLAWFSARDTATIAGHTLLFQSTSSLRVNNDEFGESNFEIPEFTLDEASSVDGRNIFFPVGENFTTTTSQMHFREANAGDRITYEKVNGIDSSSDYYSTNSVNNKEKIGHYVYRNFKLSGTSDNTPVYIKGYKITVKNSDNTDYAVFQDQLIINTTNNKPTSQTLPPDNCPIRLAFIDDSANTPKVIDPSAQVPEYADNSDGAVAAIGDDGLPVKLQATNADSFSSFYYRDQNPNPLFRISHGDNTVTLVIWLEGTLPHCEDYIGKKIYVDIDIESNFTGMEEISFIDDTQGDSGSGNHWVDGTNHDSMLVCSYKDPFSSNDSYKTVVMKKSDTYSSDYTWTASIPKKAVTDIAFYRLCPNTGTIDLQGTIWNSWHTNTNVRSWVNPNISSSWYKTGSCDLDTTRQLTDNDGNTYNSVVYRATHGNGYGLVQNSDAQKQMKRLSPCIGYWESDDSTSVTPTSAATSAPTSAPTSDPLAVCNTEVICRLSSGKGWVKNATLYFETQSGGKYYFDDVSWSDNDSITKSFNLPIGDKITAFKLSNGSTFNRGTEAFTIPNQSNCTVTYELTNDDYWDHN